MSKHHGRVLPLALALSALAACSSKKVIYQPAPDAQPAETRRSTASTLGIPPGHLPGPGECRVWVPGKPPGHQARSRRCEGIERHAPAGSWIVYRPIEASGKGKGKGHAKKVVHVRVVDERRAGVVIRVRIFDAVTGVLMSEERA